MMSLYISAPFIKFKMGYLNTTLKRWGWCDSNARSTGLSDTDVSAANRKLVTTYSVLQRIINNLPVERSQQTRSSSSNIPLEPVALPG